MEKQNTKCLTDSKAQDTKYVQKIKKQICQQKHKMFDRCETWNVLKMAKQKSQANTQNV